MSNDPVRPRPDPIAALVERMVQEVAELSDRTSPDDWPEAMIVTGDELRKILEAALRADADARPPQFDRKAFQKRVRARVAADLPEDDDGDDFQPWVWAILFEEIEAAVPRRAEPPSQE